MLQTSVHTCKHKWIKQKLNVVNVFYSQHPVSCEDRLRRHGVWVSSLIGVDAEPRRLPLSSSPISPDRRRAFVVLVSSVREPSLVFPGPSGAFGLANARLLFDGVLLRSGSFAAARTQPVIQSAATERTERIIGHEGSPTDAV